MLILGNFSVFLLVESSGFRTVLCHTAYRLNQIVPEVAVSGLVHRPVFDFKFTGVTILPDDAAVPGKKIIVRKTSHRTHLSKNASGIDFRIHQKSSICGRKRFFPEACLSPKKVNRFYSTSSISFIKAISILSNVS